MVFEQLFRKKWIERKEHAFVLGFFYTLLGLISASLIFPQSMGLMSMAFTSILLIPSLAMLLKLEENVEIREGKFSVARLFNDHKDIFKVYMFLFLGVFFAYSLVTLVFPSSAIGIMFEAQLNAVGISGFASRHSFFYSIIVNNLIVFAACFILSFVYGAGSIILITWNASVWGVSLGFFARSAASVSGKNILLEFLILILPVMPHLVTEALAYVSAAIVGGVVSKAVLREKISSEKFRHIITDALIFLVIGLVFVIIAGVIEVNVFSFR